MVDSVFATPVSARQTFFLTVFARVFYGFFSFSLYAFCGDTGRKENMDKLFALLSLCAGFSRFIMLSTFLLSDPVSMAFLACHFLSFW